MAYQEDRTREQVEKAAHVTRDFAEEGKKRVDDFAEAQSEFLDRLKEINHRWADRLRAEAELSAQTATQLTASRSFTDTANALQNWTSKHFEMAADDARRAFSDTQRIMEAGTRFWANAGRGRPFDSTRGLMS